MKDKRANQFSIGNLVREHQSQTKNKVVKSNELDFDEELTPEISQDELRKIYDYNSRVTTLDPDYASILPMSKVLVRVFLMEPNETENGLLEPYKQLVPIPTQSGVGALAHIESPFPYSNLAVVVAVPPMFTLIKPGDIVQLENNPIKPLPSGNGANFKVFIPLSYMHPSSKSMEIPQNCDNKHYGYLLIPFHEISTKVSND